jgi:hypothetical protein
MRNILKLALPVLVAALLSGVMLTWKQGTAPVTAQTMPVQEDAAEMLDYVQDYPALGQFQIRRFNEFLTEPPVLRINAFQSTPANGLFEAVDAANGARPTRPWVWAPRAEAVRVLAEGLRAEEAFFDTPPVVALEIVIVRPTPSSEAFAIMRLDRDEMTVFFVRLGAAIAQDDGVGTEIANRLELIYE